MTDDDGRGPASSLTGRLADIYLPSLVKGDIEALSRRLGSRATIDDPLYGRAMSLTSIDQLLARAAGYFASHGAQYVHVRSTTGVDRDASEGRLSMTIAGQSREIPIAVVAERRRLREIELRLYYAPEDASSERKSKCQLVIAGREPRVAQLVHGILEGIRRNNYDAVLAGFDETARVVDGAGRTYGKHEGTLGAFFADLAAAHVEVAGCADDGRTCCVEATLVRKDRAATPALFAFERGDTGLVHELRAYFE